MAYEQQSTLTTVLNFRDVGRCTPGVRTGLLFRSGHTDDASPEDCSTLRNRCGIQSVMDLRGMSPWPLIIDKEENFGSQFPERIVHQSVLGLDKHIIDIYGPQYINHQISKLSWIQKTGAFARMAVSPLDGKSHYEKLLRRKEAQTRMTATIDAIDHSGVQIKAVFKILSTPSAYPVQIMDRYGKGSTAFLVCLLLLLLDVDILSIIQDYLLSDKELFATREERARICREVGAPEEWIDGDPSYVHGIDEHLQRKYGGIEKYLLSIGLTHDDLMTIKSILVQEEQPSEKPGYLIEI